MHFNIFILIGIFFTLVGIFTGNGLRFFVGIFSFCAGSYNSFNAAIVFIGLIMLTILPLLKQMANKTAQELDKHVFDKKVKKVLPIKKRALIGLGYLLVYLSSYCVFLYLFSHNPHTIDKFFIAANSSVSTTSNPILQLLNFMYSNAILLYFAVILFKPLRLMLDNAYYEPLNS